ARTNTEGRESTSAAMLTGKIPYWGLHVDTCRRGTHRITVDVAVDSIVDWGLLGYYVGDVVQERIPDVCGLSNAPDLVRFKQYGEAAGNMGGVEHAKFDCISPWAVSKKATLGGHRLIDELRSGAAERRAAHVTLDGSSLDTSVDFVMLVFPRAAFEQIEEACL